MFSFFSQQQGKVIALSIENVVEFLLYLVQQCLLGVLLVVVDAVRQLVPPYQGGVRVCRVVVAHRDVDNVSVDVEMTVVVDWY